jgi:hypothetical protein
MNYINVLIIVFVLFIGYTFFLNKRKTEVKEINKQYSLVDDLSYSNQKTIDSGFVKPKQKLHKLFKNVSKKNKVNLENDYVNRMYTKDTMDEELLTDVKNKLYLILFKTIGLIYNVDYFLKDVLNIYQQVDFYGNKRYISSMFIYDIKNYYNFKIIIDYVIINDDLYINYVGEDISSNLNLLNNYDYTMSNIGYLENNDQMFKHIKEIMNSYYSKNFKLIGYDAPSLNYSHYISKLDSVYKLPDLSKQFLPKNIPSEYNPLFCKKNSLTWDTHGVKLEGNESCMTNNNATSREPISAFDSPATYPKNQRNKSKTYGWLQGVDYNSGGNVVSSNWFY